MEISATNLIDPNAYLSVASRQLVTTIDSIEEEKKVVAQIPSEGTDPKTDDSPDSGNETPIPLSSSVDVRSFIYAETEQEQGGSAQDSTSADSSAKPVENTDLASAENADGSGARGLTPEEEDQVQELKARDQEVRQHEQAHMAAAGSYASGGPQFEYQTGPDGKEYAIGGHVSIDTSKASSPEATIAKAKQVQRAALAPADPSPQDVKVAAQASQMMMEAQRELSEQKAEEQKSPKETEESGIQSQVSGVQTQTSSVQNAVGRLEDNGVILG
jgi:hypothetical protein